MYKHLSRPTPVSELILRINVCEAIKMITSNNITNIYQSTFFNFSDGSNESLTKGIIQKLQICRMLDFKNVY